MVPAKLDWDAGNLDKCQKHGVSVEEIEGVFASDPFTTPDEAHSQDEDRFIAIGGNADGRLIPISARYMHRKEIDRYVKLWRQEGPATHH